jgi:multicomponent Na+:H+ antiporter subunit G
MWIAVVILLAAGLVFFTGGTIGILRLPDFYTRQHAAGKMDTLALMLVTVAVALANLEHFTLHEVLTSLKILLIMFFIFLASPTATHAIVDAGLQAGMRPWTKRRGDEAQAEE